MNFNNNKIIQFKYYIFSSNKIWIIPFYVWIRFYYLLFDKSSYSLVAIAWNNSLTPTPVLAEVS